MNLDPRSLWHRTLSRLEHAGDSLLTMPRVAVGAGESSLAKLLPDSLTTHAGLPGYGHLSGEALARAEARSQGLSRPNTMVRDKAGKRHEPIALEVTGTLADLEAQLKATGWVKSKKMTSWESFKAEASLLDRASGLSRLFDLPDPTSPMSTMSLKGEAMLAGYEKNNDHDRGRDHLRIFETGRRAADGTPIYAISATRDLALETKLPGFSQGHQIDPKIDRERDMVMADLLRGGPLDWHVARSEYSPNEAKSVAAAYQTDGKLYLVRLGTPD